MWCYDGAWRVSGESGVVSRFEALRSEAALQAALGYTERAVRLDRDAIALACRLGHVPSLAQALWHCCDTLVLLEDVAAVLAAAN